MQKKQVINQQEVTEPVCNCKRLTLVRQHVKHPLTVTRFDTDEKYAKWPGPIIWLSDNESIRLDRETTITLYFSDFKNSLRVIARYKGSDSTVIVTPSVVSCLVVFGFPIEIVAVMHRIDGPALRYCIRARSLNSK